MTAKVIVPTCGHVGLSLHCVAAAAAVYSLTASRWYFHRLP